ncbi:Rod shape-determining protein RodA [Salinivirga cyanobacteriivorans]|uniref:Cell wall polymerase n=1 Tax=Salinivirga cyanobacteriivorans TaxID=1307839 RepID=A0A0S2I1R0_9BACT|nr:rod shape-determining protein RodA [Salinivirga cyanobacteriivorans]ALO16281.1 Rod shape-determining protein RodA [Salinivirga cyanobacteriivorans]
MVQRKINIYKDIDWFTVILYLVLVIMGWLNIYAAVYNEEHSSIFDLTQRYGKQLLWIVASIGIIIAIMLLDSKFYAFFAYPFYLFVVLLLIAVLLFGTEVNASRSWFTIGSFRFQPGEFAKFATALALARFMSAFNFKIHKLKNLLSIAAIIIVPAALILLQNDTGSALVYATFIIVLFREGLSSAVMLLGLFAAILFIMSLTLPLLYILIFILIVSASVAFFHFHDKKQVIKGVFSFLMVFALIYLTNTLFFSYEVSWLIIATAIVFSLLLGIRALVYRYYYLFFIVGMGLGSIAFTYSVDYFFDNVLEKHQRSRINHLLGIESDPLGAGYNVNQSKIAIGSGGLSGKGFLRGTQTKYDFVPEQSTDFIFCTVGEEWGFMGTSFVLLLFLTLLVRLIILAERQRSSFSRIYGYAVVSILFFHIAINTGMTIGLAPVIGIPLPLFSYGGSSLWAFTALLFVFLRIDASRRELLR